MNTVPTFFNKQVSLRSALFAGAGILAGLGLLLALLWHPLLRELGYTKTIESIPKGAPSGPNPLNPAPTEAAPATVEQTISRDIDLNKFYNAVQVGRDKDHLVDVSTAAPSNCSTFQVPTLGAEEICTWINGNKAVLFTILNNKILAKSKHNF